MPQRNPYAPPKAAVDTAAGAQPSQWQRAKWVFGGLWVMLTLLPVLIALLILPPPPSIGVLILNSVFALGLAAFLARDMWRLKVRRSPLLVDILLYTVALGGLVFLIVVKETKVYEWNSLHLDVPIFLLMGAVALAAWITETKKAVRIYVGSRHFIFVDGKDDL